MKDLAVFWGCTIPARFPFIEKATRMALARLGATITDVAGFTCCPEPGVVRTFDEEAFSLTAARNLALAAQCGLPLVTPCNGCYSTFKLTQAQLKTDWRAAGRVEEKLNSVGLTLDGMQPVKHLAEWVADEFQPGALASAAVRPLAGMRLAVHYGCHLLRPSPAVRWDSPTDPSRLEEILRALGATIVSYPSRMDCCGGALDRAGLRREALELCRAKVSDVREQGADALVVTCPSCFQQFDLNQAVLQRQGTDRAVPVLHVSEVLALALGCDEEELGLSMHKVPLTAFLQRWRERSLERVRLARHFNVSDLERCNACRACEPDCPSARAGGGFSPCSVIGDLVSGGLEAVLERGDAWNCLDCYTCHERCHSRLGMVEVFRTLKVLGCRDGREPAAVRSAYDTFRRTGLLGEPRESVRVKLSLPPLPRSGGEELVFLLSDDSGQPEATSEALAPATGAASVAEPRLVVSVESVAGSRNGGRR